MKRIWLTIVSVLMLVMLVASPVLAWDIEDPCVADNDDFWYGFSYDANVQELHPGGQTGNGDGYNLYRDDATDTGNLDEVYFWSFTPGEINLPPHPIIGVPGGISPDTWYWATEPRGYDNPPKERYEAPDWWPSCRDFSLWVGGMHSYRLDGNALPAIDLVVNAPYLGHQYKLRIVVEEGTAMSNPGILKMMMTPTELRIQRIDGEPMTFDQPVIVYLWEDGDWVEIANFTKA